MRMMSNSLQTCKRCRSEQEIPTHQFVKFDTSVQYLCDRCWFNFRKWFHQKGAKDELKKQFAA